MICFGKEEISCDAMNYLMLHFNVRLTDDDEMFLVPKKEDYPANTMLQIIAFLDAMEPDECDIQEDGSLRLWWD